MEHFVESFESDWLYEADENRQVKIKPGG